MIDIPNLFSTITAAAIVLCMGLILRAFHPLVTQRLEPFGEHMVKGLTYLAVGTMARASFWDILPDLLGSGWPAFRDALGGLAFNAFFNLIVLFATYHFLHARFFAIPEEERREWRWYTAWAHPGDNCIINWRRKP